MTARNSSPLTRCIVPTATAPDTPSDSASSCTARRPAAYTADSVGSICAGDLTNTLMACGT